MVKQGTSEWESLKHKTQCCPLLSEGKGWERLAKALPLSTLISYEEIVSRWCRYGDKNTSYPVCDWLRGKISTKKFLTLNSK